MSAARNGGNIAQYFLDMNDLASGNFWGTAADVGALEAPP